MSGDKAGRSNAKAGPLAGATASGTAVPAARARRPRRTSPAAMAVPPAAAIPARTAAPARPGSAPRAPSPKARPKPKRPPGLRRKHKPIPKARPAKDRPLEAGARAVQVLWSQASLLTTLIGLLSYGLGRLMADGFYGELHTTAEAAGLGYTSILEPAALLTAIAAIAGTALAATWDALLAAARWLIEHRHGVLLVLGVAAVLGGAAFLITIVRLEELLAFLSSASVLAFKTLLSKLRGIRGHLTGRNSGAPASAAAHAVGFHPPPSTKLQRVASVALSIAVLAGLFFTAHEFGIHEGKQAASGKSVSITILGFNIPSITATVVSVQPDAPGPALDQLGKARCLLQVGPGSSELVLYNPATKATTTAPADHLLVSSAGPACPK